MTPTLRLNVLTLAAALLVSSSAQHAAAQTTAARSRDLSEAWSAAPSLLPSTAAIPSWNAQPNSWRLGVAIQNVDTGVVLTDVEAGMPAQQAGLENGDIIVNVDGFQVGYVEGALFDLGDEIRRRVDQNGKVDFLVFDNRNRRLQNLPVTLAQQNAASVRGEITCKERVMLTQQAVLTVRLRDVTYPNWQNVEVGKQVITNPKHPPIPFSIAVDRTQIYPDHKYAVDAYLVDNGKILLQSSAAIPVNLLSNTAPIQINLVKVGANVPPSNTYAVGQLDQINQWYKQYLRRDALPTELNAWQNYLQAGKSPQDIQAYILGSPEYFDRMGNQRDPYLAALYQTLLGRQPTAAEMQQFVAQYQQYGGARTDFVRDVMRLQP
ncbi:YbaY family lipoprotein [Lacipirellula sp.]|uniref:YbaY family lipoprotein n=1 Tax=Lacipirellula sp. TaxID=2691419 RepID=UPI003D09A596